jgi:DNA-binding transcriptional regulator YiaG
LTTLTVPVVSVTKPTVPFSLAFGAALVALCAAVPVADWTVTRVQTAPAHLSYGMGTFTGQRIAPSVSAVARSAAESIVELRALSGLTADQVGRLLGVSRRSVQNWVAGNAMAGQHEEQVSRLLSVVLALPGSTADARRGALLDSSRGQSLFHKLLDERVEAVKVQGSAVSVGERIAL